MSKISYYPVVIILLFSITCTSCWSGQNKHRGTHQDEQFRTALNHQGNLPFDSNLVTDFYRSYPELKKYRDDVLKVYRQHKFTRIWFDEKGVLEFGYTLYAKEKELAGEGVFSRFPYQEKIDGIFETDRGNRLSITETELMLTNLYLYYTEKVYQGLSDSTTTAIGWLLPRKTVSYARLLDSIMSDPQSLNGNDSVLSGQYYKLRDYLKKYTLIQKQGGWKTIEPEPGVKSIKPGDSSGTVLQIRDRLFITGELKQNNKSNRYDPELVAAVKQFKLHNGINIKAIILPEHIRAMNVPVSDRIKTIIVNMERYRWISPEFARAKVYIVVNIPSFRLTLVRDGKSELESAVIVGDSLTKTVIFSGMMSSIVFSPYWNVPQSIIEKEIKPGIAKNKNYLEDHNLEWYKGVLRQKPGKNNSLGLIKFIFPNVDDIYMHDTPAKSLFGREKRAFSHGCIRVAKPRELAIDILKDDPAWTPAKIDAAMHAGVESTYSLKHKIPVYIGYQTAWVDRTGEINFYPDIYNRDERLARLLIDEK